MLTFVYDRSFPESTLLASSPYGSYALKYLAESATWEVSLACPTDEGAVGIILGEQGTLRQAVEACEAHALLMGERIAVA